VSIPANIAEGCGRRTDDDFARFLDEAMGSASEVEYDLLLARDLGFLRAHDRGQANARLSPRKIAR
jgi:four helix bundle protein